MDLKDMLARYTCVLYKDEQVYTSTQRGVRPLLEALDAGCYVNFSAADRVVGSGAAFMYCLLQVKAVYAQTISLRGKEILESSGISVTFDNLVPAIQNRKGDGLCPMELATAHCHTPEEARLAMLEALKKLS